MTPSVVARRTLYTRVWLIVGSGLLVALCALLFDARSAHAQTVYHVDDDADDGLVAHWQFDHISATSLDYRNLITATLTGFSSLDGSYTNNVPTLLRDNPRSITLDGTNDIFTVADDARLNVAGNFTVAAWVRRDSINTYEPIYDAGSNTNSWWFFISGNPVGTTNDNRLGFGIRDINEYYADTIIPADGQWRHVAMVLDTSTNPNLRFYINGVLDGSEQVTESITVPSGVKQIGAITDLSLEAAYHGGLDEVRFYDRVLAQTEIARLAAGRTCVTDGLAWATAFSDLNCALELSTFGDTVRVAKGRYLPGINPEALFKIDIGDNIQGGFDGDEALNEGRPPIDLDPATPGDYLDGNQYTVLTGDVLGNDPTDALTDPLTVEDEEADNLRQIFSINTAAVGTFLDGVVVNGARNDNIAGGGSQIQGAPTISNAIFVFNRAQYGGGLFIRFDASPTLSNLRFVGNEALIFGGGIEAENFFTLENTRFISNTAGDSGGGLDLREEGAVLTNVDFERNLAPSGGGLYISPNIFSFSYTDGELVNNKAEKGGGIHTQAAATLSNLTLRANEAITAGGGIFSDAPLTILNATILSNTQTGVSFDSDDGGGGIYSSNSLTLTNATVQGNEANSGGGVLVEDVSIALSVLMNNVTFRANHVTNSNGGGLHLVANEHPVTARLTDITFTENSTGDDEGAGMAVNAIGDVVTLTGLRLTVNNNRATQNGGGISLEGNVGVQINSSTFDGNEAGQQGGGLYLSGLLTSPQLTNVTFRDNHALASQGGALYLCCTDVALQVTNVLVDGNRSLGDGGGIYLCCSASLTGQHLTLQNNESSSNGGGLALCCGGDSTLQQITVTANSAITSGGGIYLTGGANLTVTNGLLNNNEAGDDGAGVHHAGGADFTLITGRVEGNRAQSNGGGIFADVATLRLTNVQIVRNHTNNGSGGGIFLSTSLDSVLRQVDFIENSLDDDNGAGLLVRGGNATVDRARFHGNAADQSGALAAEDAAVVTVTNAIFVGNIGNTGGGPNTDGNALHVDNGSAMHVLNSSFAANSGAGRSLFELQDNGTLTLTNVILWDNTPPREGNNSTGSLVEQIVIIGNPTTGVDPRFLRNPDAGDGNWATLNDNDYGDLQLSNSSPALDQGNGALLPAGISQDLLGNARIFDVGYLSNAFASPVDLGAFEARFAAPIANAGGPYSGDEGQAIALDGTLSSDDSGIVTYAWDCTNDGTIDTTSSNPTGQSCIYPDQGVFVLRLQVTDGDTLSNDSTVNVTISNVAPIAQNDSASTPVATAVTINVLANDSDVPADPLTISAVSAPLNGSAMIESGQVRYSPTTGFVGNDTFTYTVSDGDGGSATATVNVTVTPVGGSTLESIHLPLLAKE